MAISPILQGMLNGTQSGATTVAPMVESTTLPPGVPTIVPDASANLSGQPPTDAFVPGNNVIGANPLEGQVVQGTEAVPEEGAKKPKKSFKKPLIIGATIAAVAAMVYTFVTKKAPPVN